MDETQTVGSKIAPFFTLQGFVVASVFIVYAISIGMLLFRPMPMDGQAGTLLTTMMGALTGSVVTIVSYYFGSSKSSSDKDQTIQTIVKKEGTPDTPKQG